MFKLVMGTVPGQSKKGKKKGGRPGAAGGREKKEAKLASPASLRALEEKE